MDKALTWKNLGGVFVVDVPGTAGWLVEWNDGWDAWLVTGPNGEFAEAGTAEEARAKAEEF